MLQPLGTHEGHPYRLIESISTIKLLILQALATRKRHTYRSIVGRFNSGKLLDPHLLAPDFDK
jgi:hypothetical protein